jgi:hypothetical protein
MPEQGSTVMNGNRRKPRKSYSLGATLVIHTVAGEQPKNRRGLVLSLSYLEMAEASGIAGDTAIERFGEFVAIVRFLE